MFLLYILVSSSLLFSTYSRLLLFLLVSSSLLFSSLLIHGFFSTLLFPLLFSTHSKLLLFLLVSSSLLYSFKASSLHSCSPFSSLLIQSFFSTFLFPLLFSSLPFSSHSRLLLYLLVPPSLLLSFKVSSLPSCSNHFTCIPFLSDASFSCFIFFF